MREDLGKYSLTMRFDAEDCHPLRKRIHRSSVILQYMDFVVIVKKTLRRDNG